VAALALEFFLLFFAAPTVFAFTRHRIPAIPALWGLLLYCIFVMRSDHELDRLRFWDPAKLWPHLPSILSLFAVILAIGIVLILRYAPGRFLSLPRSNPVLWCAVMVLYPLLSVYPQGVIYRAFVFTRYRSLFEPGWAIVLASAAAFAYVHIVFRNTLAVGLSFLAGLLFAVRYLQTGSIFASSFEHALYGCTIFTIGLGQWFFYGAVRARAG
jgi:hypothetical protein